MIKLYLRKIFRISKRGDAREESYYSTLEELIKNYLDSTGKKKIEITTLPKKTEAGNPDFRIWDGKQHIVGYIEAKAPTIEHLDQIEATDQLKRYLTTFSNLILTNFFEFRFYRNGVLMEKVIIAKPPAFPKPVQSAGNEQEFFNLLDKFFSFSLPKVYNAKTLAIELAKRTRFLRDEVIAEQLEGEEKAGKGFILGFYEAFRKYLIHGLLKEEFADLYSQTITYGLFAARTRSENGFNRKLAYDSIPHTIGILRDVFKFISLEDLPRQMEWIIDDISEILAVTDVKKILRQFFREGKGKDPIFHFYETFLAEYDPQTREKRGVYYTPEPVVSYIVRSLHSILKEHFKKPNAFANDLVTVLDPAAGTLTFLAYAAKLAVEEFVSKYGEGGRENFIREHILKNFYGFELMMAPYSIGHLKMSFLLEELGYKMKGDDRFKLYLTNTLEMEELAQTKLPGMASLSEESQCAGKVKKEQPILVILGNPPYSGHSANRSWEFIYENKKGKTIRRKIKTWIGNLIDNYKIVDGKQLIEKNPKWLQDDYVKFIRFAQWKIDQLGEGVLAFISNHSYLDNPTFRGMRQSLMDSFNEIYILDLHGNSLKKEKCPDGSKDENVFDIRQGVAIAFFIKKNAEKKECKIFHSDIWGLRENKYDWLLKYNIKKTNWHKLFPKSEFYLFIPRDESLLEAYEKYPKIRDIFPSNSVGIVTARDKLTIHWSKEEIWSTVLNFSKMDSELVRITYNLGKDAKDWKVELAQKDLIDSGLDKNKIVPILYRPFDIRYTYYTGKSSGFHCRPRPEVMHHMMKENLGLLTCRQQNKVGFQHNLVCEGLVESCLLSNQTREIDYIFPLYVYPHGLFSQGKGSEKKEPNIKLEFIAILSKNYKKEILPEEIFYYIYSVLYSNIYRTKYSEFLKIDFPRIPFIKDYKLFKKMGEYGKRLVDMHLLKSKELDSPVVKCQGKGDKKVKKLRYDEKEKRVYFDQSQYFDGVTKELWRYQIGSYQICNKWLKDRKGRVLTLGDIKHYCKVVTAIKKTIEIQKEIDKLYPKIEEKTIEFNDS